jgi:hypothetical protein
MKSRLGTERVLDMLSGEQDGSNLAQGDASVIGRHALMSVRAEPRFAQACDCSLG